MVGVGCVCHDQTLDNRPCPASDLWFVGVLVYLLLGGSPPFLGADDDAMQKAIRGAEVSQTRRMST